METSPRVVRYPDRNVYRPLLGPLLTLGLLAAVTLAGGVYNSVDATGYVVDNWTNQPLKAEIRLGKRIVGTAEDGSFDFGAVPRGSGLQARAQGYGVVNFDAGQREIRMTPATLNLKVVDRTDTGIGFPEARKGDRVIGRGTESGNMVIAPHPGRDEPFTVCAKDLGPVEFKSHSVVDKVTLPVGPGCPPPPGQPSPSPSPTAQPQRP